MRKVKLFKPFVSWYAVWNVVGVLRSGQLAEGPRVKEFEEKFGQRFGLPNALAVNSGTAAVATARKLLAVIYRLLKDNRPFESRVGSLGCLPNNFRL